MKTGRRILALSALVPVLATGRLAGEPDQSPCPPVQTGTITSGPFRLAYRIEGSGPPAMVVGSSLYNSRLFSADLRRHLRLIFIDDRLHVPAPPKVGGEEFALDRLVGDMELVRQHLGLGRVAVVGHAGHALVAIEYARRHPAGISHLILIGSGPEGAACAATAEKYWEESASPERKAVLQENHVALPDDDVEHIFPPHAEFIARMVRDGPKLWYEPRFDAAPLWEGVFINTEGCGHFWRRLPPKMNPVETLATFHRPVYVALGRHDFVAGPPGLWDPLQAKLTDLTVRVFEYSGHAPHYEEPERFDRKLVRWIKKKSQAPFTPDP